MANMILTAYTGLFFLRFIFHWVLTVFNMNAGLKEGTGVPEFAAKWINEEKYSKTRAYTQRKGDFGLIHFALSSLVLLVILYSGLPGKLDLWISSLISSPVLAGIGFFLIFSLIMDILEIPFDVYGQFIIEEEFGFNKMTGKIWLTDKLKGALLSLILGIPLLGLLFLFMEKSGTYWWLYGWISFSLFQIIISLLYPTLIAPLFNKFTPLDEGELKESLEALSRECGFKTKGIFLMDGSRRSGHSNAYFTGLGKAKRIVLFDTLVENLTTEELTAVMAHEIGHFKKRHIIKRLITSLLSTLALFFLLSLALDYTPLFQAFSFSAPSSHGILFILMFFSSPFTYFFSPLLSRSSRKHEYEADHYAWEVMGSSRGLQEALIKLNRDNLSQLTPHKLYSTFYYSHPPLKERWDALEKLSCEPK
jgi:STE24 endopeptidase